MGSTTKSSRLEEMAAASYGTAQYKFGGEGELALSTSMVDVEAGATKQQSDSSDNTKERNRRVRFYYQSM